MYNLEGQRILFVTCKMSSVEPLGIMYLSAGIKKYGGTTKFYMYKSQKDFIVLLDTFKPTILALSITTGQQIQLIAIGTLAKFHNSNIVIVAGNAHVTYFPEISKNDVIDYIIRGDADISFLQLVQDIKNGKKFEDKDRSNYVLPTDLDLLPFPDREVVYEYSIFRNNTVRNVMTSRGCPFACSYCYSSAYKMLYKGQKIVRYRSAENIIQECKELIDTYKTTMIFFADDEFSMNISQLEQLSKLYKKHINIPFHCQLRIDLLDEYKIKLLKDMGCYSVTFAIESGNEYLRKNMLLRNMANIDIEIGMSLLKKYKLLVRIDNMLGLPFETFDNMLETLDLNIKLKPDYAWVSIYQPFPNTVLEKFCREKGVYTNNSNDIQLQFTEESVLFLSKWDKFKLCNLQRLFSFVVQYPILRQILWILIRLPLTHFYTFLRDFEKKHLYKKIFIGVT